jgi:hypothetical protein
LKDFTEDEEKAVFCFECRENFKIVIVEGNGLIKGIDDKYKNSKE